MNTKEILAAIFWMRANSFKLKESRLRLDMRNKFFTVRHFCKLLRKIVATTFLEELKAKWSNVV